MASESRMGDTRRCLHLIIQCGIENEEAFMMLVMTDESCVRLCKVSRQLARDKQ